MAHITCADIPWWRSSSVTVPTWRGLRNAVLPRQLFLWDAVLGPGPLQVEGRCVWNVIAIE